MSEIKQETGFKRVTIKHPISTNAIGSRKERDKTIAAIKKERPKENPVNHHARKPEGAEKK